MRLSSSHVRGAWRALQRNRGHTLLNIAGLALGLATFIAVGLYVLDEWSFDRFHERPEEVYRVAGEYTSADGTRAFARANPAAAPLLRREIPEVSEAVRLFHDSEVVRVGDETWLEEDIFFAEPSFFEVFTFPLIAGSALRALSEPNTAVLTRRAALTYFGTEDVIGNTLHVGEQPVQISGVALDPPANSHIQFRLLISWSTHQAQRPEVDLDNTWSRGIYYTYVRLVRDADRAAVQGKVKTAVDGVLGVDQEDGTRMDLRLQPLLDIHLKSDLRQDLGPGGSLTNLISFSLIALMILFISCLNFVNLATAMAASRSAEVGVRKSLGASKRQLISQFVTEAVLISVLALVVSLAIVALVLPGLNGLSGKELTLGTLSEPWAALALFSLGLSVGTFSGFYPAAVLSSFQPVKALSGDQLPGVNSRLRQALVVTQFSASVFLIGGTLVALSQVRHLRAHDLGMDAAQVAVIPFQWNPDVQQAFPTLRQQFLEVPGVNSVTASGDVPGRIFTSMSVWGEGMPAESSTGMNALILDPDFVETYGLEVVAGRDFSHDFASDWTDGFLLNERAAAQFGWTAEEAVGKALRMNGPGQVVGVLRDFHYVGAQAAIEPIVMAMWPDWFGYISVRVDGRDLERSLAGLEVAWGDVVGALPFQLIFLDEDFDRLYRTEVQFGRLFAILAGLAIFIACLGLYGLAAHSAARRRKELGVRKVLGAGVAGLTALLMRRQMTLLAIAILVASPVTWLVMSSWLDRFAIRIELSAQPLIAAAAITLPVAVLAVLYQTLRAAMVDPARSLRQE